MCFSLPILVVALLCPSTVALGYRGCATSDPNEEQQAKSKIMVDAFIAGGGINKSRRGVVEIETYWHTIHTSGGEGELSEDAISNSIQILNDAFAAQFKFVLRNNTKSTNPEFWGLQPYLVGQSYMKKELRRGSCAALNIYSSYLANSYLGWATFPGFCQYDQINDGVVIGYGTVPGGSSAPYNKGHTLTHEVGHWLNLYHTFQGGCNSIHGDLVDDTPAVRFPSFGCPRGKDSCSFDRQGPDLVNNFMDYADDACMDSFTAGQNTRMQASWYSDRYDEPPPTDEPTAAPTDDPYLCPAKNGRQCLKNGCVWNKKEKECNVCSSIVDDKICIHSGCVWSKYKGGLCQSCTDSTNQNKCQIKGCIWGKDRCSSCRSRFSIKACANAKCIMQENVCTSCAEIQKKKDCKKLKCNWNNKKKCNSTN